MSYLNAFVAFRGGSATYPVNCMRSDVCVGDVVVVVNNDGDARIGTVETLVYHNWNCRWSIRCKATEAVSNRGRLEVDPSVPSRIGKFDLFDVPRHLAATGWTRRAPASRLFKIGYTSANRSQACNILVRTNGFDVSFSDNPTEHIERDSPLSISTGTHRVRHSLNESSVNLIEYMIAFADDFRSDRSDIASFLKPIGQSRKVKPARDRADTSLDEIYDAIGGVDGVAYLGDGVYLTAGGGWFND